jgi:hypothetical protein
MGWFWNRNDEQDSGEARGYGDLTDHELELLNEADAAQDGALLIFSVEKLHPSCQVLAVMLFDNVSEAALTDHLNHVARGDIQLV